MPQMILTWQLENEPCPCLSELGAPYSIGSQSGSADRLRWTLLVRHRNTDRIGKDEPEIQSPGGCDVDVVEVNLMVPDYR